MATPPTLDPPDDSSSEAKYYLLKINNKSELGNRDTDGSTVNFFDAQDIGLVQSTNFSQPLNIDEFKLGVPDPNTEWITLLGEATKTFQKGPNQAVITWSIGSNNNETEKNLAQAFVNEWNIGEYGRRSPKSPFGTFFVGPIVNEICKKADSQFTFSTSDDVLEFFQKIADGSNSYLELAAGDLIFETRRPHAEVGISPGSFIEIFNDIIGDTENRRKSAIDDSFHNFGRVQEDFQTLRNQVILTIGNIFAGEDRDGDGAVDTDILRELKTQTNTPHMISGIRQNYFLIKSLSGNLSLMNFSQLSDTPTGYESGKYLVSTASGIEYQNINLGDSALTGLSDTPNSYESGKFLISNNTGIEYGSPSISFLQDIIDRPSTELVSGYLSLDKDRNLVWRPATTDGDVQYVITGATHFTGLLDTPSIYQEGKYLKSTANGFEYADVDVGSSKIIDLKDTPNTYNDGQFLVSSNTGIEYGSPSISFLEDITDRPSIELISGFLSLDKDRNLIWKAGTTTGDVSYHISGATHFTGLSDTPSLYEVGKFLESTANGLQYSDLSGKISSQEVNWLAYASLSDLPSASEHHGMFAHVHSEGAAYMAHAGDWEKIYPINSQGGGSSTFTGLSDTPSTYNGGKFLQSTANGLEWVDMPAGGGGGSSNILAQGTYDASTLQLTNDYNISGVTRKNVGFYKVTFDSPIPNREYNVFVSPLGAQPINQYIYSSDENGFHVSSRHNGTHTNTDHSFDFVVFGISGAGGGGGGIGENEKIKNHSNFYQNIPDKILLTNAAKDFAVYEFSYITDTIINYSQVDEHSNDILFDNDTTGGYNTHNEATHSGDSPSTSLSGFIEQGRAIYLGGGSSASTGAGSSTFSGLSDTPSNFIGKSGQYVKVNDTEDGLEFVNYTTQLGAGGVGSHTGVRALSNFNADLPDALINNENIARLYSITSAYIWYNTTPTENKYIGFENNTGAAILSASNDTYDYNTLQGYIDNGRAIYLGGNAGGAGNILSARISGDGTIVNQTPEWIESCTRSSNGAYDIIYKSDYFSSIPTIVATADLNNGVSQMNVQYDAPSLNGITINTFRNDNGGSLDADFSIIAHDVDATSSSSQGSSTFSGLSYTDTDVAAYLNGNLDTHIIPDTNSVYDIGSAEKKIRHLFLSDNSLKFVGADDIEHSLSVSDNQLRFDNEPVPQKFIDLPDVPSTLDAGSYLRVNTAGDAVEQVDIAPPNGGVGSFGVIKNKIDNFYTQLPDAIIATTAAGYEAILRLKFANNQAGVAGTVNEGRNFWYEARVQTGGSNNDYIITFTDTQDGNFKDHAGEADQFPTDGSMDQSLRWFIENNRALYDGNTKGGVGSNSGISNYVSGNYLLPDAITVPLTRSSINDHQARLFNFNGLILGTNHNNYAGMQYTWSASATEIYKINFNNDTNGSFDSYSETESTTTTPEWSEIPSAINNEPSLQEFIDAGRAIYYNGEPSSDGSSSSITGSSSITLPSGFILQQVSESLADATSINSVGDEILSIDFTPRASDSQIVCDVNGFVDAAVGITALYNQDVQFHIDNVAFGGTDTLFKTDTYYSENVPSSLNLSASTIVTDNNTKTIKLKVVTADNAQNIDYTSLFITIQEIARSDYTLS